MLVAAMNPTPDGAMPDQSQSTSQEIRRYFGKIYGPFLDRVDMRVKVLEIPFDRLLDESKGEPSSVVRQPSDYSEEIPRGAFSTRGRLYFV